MTTQIIVVIAIIALTAASVGAVVGVAYAETKGIDVGATVANAGVVTDTVQQVYTMIKPLLPSSATATIDTILNLADVGVNLAEKLYKTAKVGKDERKDCANEFVITALESAGIEITEEMKTVIDGAITGACECLPKTHDGDGNIIL